MTRDLIVGFNYVYQKIIDVLCRYSVLPSTVSNPTLSIVLVLPKYKFFVPIHNLSSIPAGVCTRWNFSLDSALALYKVRAKFGENVNSFSCTADVAPLLRLHLYHLSASVYRILRDLVIFPKPQLDMTLMKTKSTILRQVLLLQCFLRQDESWAPF